MHQSLLRLVIACVIVVMTGIAQAGLKSQTVEYKVDGKPHTGYLVYDDSIKGKRPGIIVVHEWWGHNEFTRGQAEQLARAGFTAFALDMYGSGKLADHPADAEAFMNEAISDFDLVEARFRKAMTILGRHDTVDDSRLAAQGYCFGGAIVLNMARIGIDLAGVVSFHGALGAAMPAEPGVIQARIQVYTGADDPMIPVEQVAGFVEEMTAAGADFTLRSYPGVVHSFMNPGATEVGERFGMPLAYDEAAASRSWDATMAFYRELFE